MEKLQIETFSKIDFELHSMIHETSEVLKTLTSSNSKVTEKILNLLEQAHCLVHNLDYESK